MNTKQVLFFHPLSMTSQFNPSNFRALFETIEEKTKEILPDNIKTSIKRLILSKQKTFRDVSNGLNVLNANIDLGIVLEKYNYETSDVSIRARLLRSPSGHLIAEIKENLELDKSVISSWYVK